MPLLDGQGRLFGRLNLLDLSAGALLGAAAIAGYLALARPANLRHALHDEARLEAFRVEVLPDRPFLLEDRAEPLEPPAA